MEKIFNLLDQIVVWFIQNKMYDRREKIEFLYAGILKRGRIDTEGQKKLFAFMLFTFSMEKGEKVFLEVQELSKRLDLDNWVKYWSND